MFKKRSNPNTNPDTPTPIALPVSTRNYVYKVKSIVSNADLINNDIHAAHTYKNQLIAIERDRRTAYNALLAEFDPEIPAIESQIAEIEDQSIALENAIKARGQTARQRSLATAEEKATKANGKAQLRALRATLKVRKTAIHAVTDSPFHARNAAISDMAFAARKQAYNDSTALWGTKISAADDLEDMNKGRPPRFRRWSYDGGCVAVQIQKGMEWAAALLCRDTRLRIEIPSSEPRPTHGTATGAFLPQPDPDSERSENHKLALIWLRVGTADDGRSPIWAKLHVHIDRQPPPDTRIKWVYLHRYLVGRRVCWKLRFALSRPSWDAQHGDDGTVGVEIGWRMTEQGLRVGLAVGDDESGHELVMPYDMNSPIARPRTVTLFIPREKIDKFEHANSLRAIRDRCFNAMKDSLLAWLRDRKDKGADIPEWLAEEAKYIHQWRTPDRLQSLVWKWKDHRFPGDRSIAVGMMDWRRGHARLMGELGPHSLHVFAELEAWRKHDRHIHDWEDNERAKVIKWRNELYRRFAAIVCRNYRTVAIKDVNWLALKAKALAGEPDNSIVRMYVQMAAPGTLQAYIAEAAHTLVKRKAAWTTMTCNECGNVDKWDSKDELRHACSSCGAEWDQDWNSAVNLRDGRVCVGV